MLSPPVERAEPRVQSPASGRRPAAETGLGEWAAALAIAGLAAGLLLANLGNQYLWQDEAQTALLARSILRFGVPVGFDGLNSFSQELGIEYGPDAVWKWHTWLSFYAVAGSFALLGADTLPARLPFALCGLAAVVLTWRVGRELWGDPRAGLCSALLLALSVPFLILCRQSRYYALASLLSLLGLWAYTRVGSGSRRAPLALFATATLLFHTHYVYAATLLASVLLHAALVSRERLRPAVFAAAATAAAALPWMLWMATLRPGTAQVSRLLDLADTPGHVVAYARLLFDRLWLHGAFLALPLAIAAARAWRGEAPFAVAPETRRNAALLVVFAAVTILMLALLNPLPLRYVRYLTPLLPPLFLLAGLFVGELWRVSRPLAAAAVVAFAWQGSLRDFAGELTHDYDGPIEGIVRFLREHAREGDVVAMVHGDLPVKFYTGLRVVGGLTGEDLSDVERARFIALRGHIVAPVSREVRERFEAELHRGRFRQHVLPYPEIAFENREDPRLHRFRTAQGVPPVVIWERLP
jgi:4-amino-4-deoxy-L-arabinose transferase-like glycosyltransferase